MTPPPASDGQFESRMKKLDTLLQQVESIADPAARETTVQIIDGLMEFHGAALHALFEKMLEAGPAGRAIATDASRDSLVRSLLLLYDLHPQDLETRVAAALDQVRPYLASHGGGVELLRIDDDGAVHLALKGSCHSCPSSTITLKNSVEQAIHEWASDVPAIHVQEDPAAAAPADSAGFVSVESLMARAAQNHSPHQSPQGASI